MTHCQTGITSFPSIALAADLIPEYTNQNGNKRKWEIIEDGAPSTFKISDLELVSFLKKRANPVSGETMRKRAADLRANLGLADAKYVLEHQAEISDRFQNYYLVFPGTVLRDHVGYLNVACLCWSGGRWCLLWSWLGRGWDGGVHFVRYSA